MAQKKAKTPNIPQAKNRPQTSQVVAPAAKVRRSARQRQQRRNQMWLLVAAGLVTLGILLLIYFTNRSQAQISAPPVVSGLPAELVNRNVKGSADAKVVVTEFSDFECPACKNFATTTAKLLDEEYVKTGKIRFEYKHYPLPQHEPSATNGANAAECAADQGKFWDLHDYMFQEQGKAGSNTFTQIRLESMAKALGLNTSEFNKCLSRRTHADKVQANISEANRLFINATPTIFVNGQKIANPTIEEMRKAIDAALASAGS